MILHIIRHADPDYANNTITEFGKQEAEALAVYMGGSSAAVLIMRVIKKARGE